MRWRCYRFTLLCRIRFGSILTNGQEHGDEAERSEQQLLSLGPELARQAAEALRGRPDADFVGIIAEPGTLEAKRCRTKLEQGKVAQREWTSRLLMELAFDAIVKRDTRWAKTMATDMDRHGVETVIEAAFQRLPGRWPRRGDRPAPYPGSTKALMQFRKALSEAWDLANIPAEVPDLHGLHAKWDALLKGARYEVVERAPGSVILGDVGMVVQYSDDDELLPFDFESPSDVSAVLLPISSRRLLVGATDPAFDTTGVAVEGVNDASARWSDEFFVASRRRSGFEVLRTLMIEDWEDEEFDEDG